MLLPVGPVRDATQARRSAQRVVTGLLYPNRRACCRIERLGEAKAVAGVEHAIHHDGSRAEIVVRAKRRRQGDVGRRVRTAPRHFQRSDVRSVDLIERRVFGRRVIRGIHSPLPIVRARGSVPGLQSRQRARRRHTSHPDDVTRSSASSFRSGQDSNFTIEPARSGSAYFSVRYGLSMASRSSRILVAAEPSRWSVQARNEPHSVTSIIRASAWASVPARSSPCATASVTSCS